MPIYTYKASDNNGKLVKGYIEAGTLDGVADKLHAMNFLPIKIEEGKNKQTLLSYFSFSFIFLRISEKEILNFTQQLSTLIDAGIPLDRSLTIVLELIPKNRLKTIIDNVQKDIHSGASFAEAISKHPKAFSKVYISMVKAGEVGGILDSILKKLSDFLENSINLKDSVRSAMIYPAILAVVGGGAVTVLLTFVVPRFASIFMDMGQLLPMPTKILLNLSEFITQYIVFIFVGICAGLFSFRLYITTRRGREMWDMFKLKIPLIGTLITRIEVSRFSRTLGTLLKSGVSILKSLDIVKDTLTNVFFAKSIIKLNETLKRGGVLSEPLKKNDIFPPLAIHMIAVGEETGKLEEMLLKVADTYDKEVQVSVKRAISLIEPLMILFMGLIVGFIVISMLMAIFSVNDIPF